MKKNVMMRVASALLVAVLLTTCAISGTFAKYTTYSSSNDTARVAKWGVTIAVSGADAFAEAYKDTADTRSSATATVESKLNDGSTNGDDVLAPGTKGTLATINVDGAPEVDVDVTVAATFVLSGDWTVPVYKSFKILEDDPDTLDVNEEKWETRVQNQFYCPLIITFKDGTSINGASADYFKGEFVGENESDYTSTQTDFVNAIITKICGEVDGSKTTTVQANAETLATDFDQEITWEWAFTNKNATTNAIYDAFDTALGNKTGDNVPKVNFSVSVEVTQVD